MARSKYIYIVVDTHIADEFVAIFTVKHEAFSFIKRHMENNTERYKIIRIPDGYMPVDWYTYVLP